MGELVQSIVATRALLRSFSEMEASLGISVRIMQWLDGTRAPQRDHVKFDPFGKIKLNKGNFTPSDQMLI